MFMFLSMIQEQLCRASETSISHNCCQLGESVGCLKTFTNALAYALYICMVTLASVIFWMPGPTHYFSIKHDAQRYGLACRCFPCSIYISAAEKTINQLY